MAWLERSSKSLRRKLSIGDSLRDRPNVPPKDSTEPMPHSAPPTAAGLPMARNLYNSNTRPNTSRPKHQPLRVPNADNFTQATNAGHPQESPIFHTPGPSPCTTAPTLPFHPARDSDTRPSLSGPRLPPLDPLRSCPRVVNDNQQFGATSAYITPPARSFSEPVVAKADTTPAEQGHSSALETTKQRKPLKKVRSIRNFFSRGAADSPAPPLPTSHPCVAQQETETKPVIVNLRHGQAGEQEPTSAAGSTYSVTVESSASQRRRAESDHSYFDRSNVTAWLNGTRRRSPAASQTSTDGNMPMAAPSTAFDLMPPPQVFLNTLIPDPRFSASLHQMPNFSTPLQYQQSNRTEVSLISTRSSRPLEVSPEQRTAFSADSAVGKYHRKLAVPLTDTDAALHHTEHSPSAAVLDYSLAEQFAALAPPTKKVSHVTAYKVPAQHVTEGTTHSDQLVADHKDAWDRYERQRAQRKAGQSSRVASPAWSEAEHGPASPESGGTFYSADEQGGEDELVVPGISRASRRGRAAVVDCSADIGTASEDER